MDKLAGENWDAYTRARDAMLLRTHSDHAPWTIIRSNSKKVARLNMMRHFVHTLGCPTLSAPVPEPDQEILFRFEPAALQDGRMDS